MIKKNKIKNFLFNDASTDDTIVIADLFANFLKCGDVLLLIGDIGSGKTFFSRRIIQSMMKNQNVLIENIPSPTFSIVQTYDLLYPVVWHLDLYRLSDSNEIIELGLDEGLGVGICLIEWPDRLGDYYPQRNISITFDELDKDDSNRRISIEFNGMDWEYLANAITNNYYDKISW